MLFTAPGAADYISGVILYDETIRQKTKDGIAFFSGSAARLCSADVDNLSTYHRALLREKHRDDVPYVFRLALPRNYLLADNAEDLFTRHLLDERRLDGTGGDRVHRHVVRSHLARKSPGESSTPAFDAM